MKTIDILSKYCKYGTEDTQYCISLLKNMLKNDDYLIRDKAVTSLGKILPFPPQTQSNIKRLKDALQSRSNTIITTVSTLTVIDSVQESESIQSTEVVKMNIPTQQQKMDICMDEEKKMLMRKYFNAGTQLYQQGKYEEAIKEWIKILDLDPMHKLTKQKIEKSLEMLKIEQ